MHKHRGEKDISKATLDHYCTVTSLRVVVVVVVVVVEHRGENDISKVTLDHYCSVTNLTILASITGSQLGKKWYRKRVSVSVSFNISGTVTH